MSFFKFWSEDGQFQFNSISNSMKTKMAFTLVSHFLDKEESSRLLFVYIACTSTVSLRLGSLLLAVVTCLAIEITRRGELWEAISRIPSQNKRSKTRDRSP